MSRSHRSEVIYRPAWWVPGAHAQTLWGKFFRRRRKVPAHLERWDTPDDDFLELYRMPGPPGGPRLVLLHGLEGTVRSHYVAAFFDEAAQRGWAADLLIFRSCGSELNRAPRFYHSGETTDLSLVLDRLITEDRQAPIALAGVSLGGNVVLKFLGERGELVSRNVVAAATISVPYDLERGARFISSGFSRIYDRHFLSTLRAKALRKLERYPALFSREQLAKARTLMQFDDVVTAPIHGFQDAHDYYTRSSSLRWLNGVRVPTFLLSAIDDPFLPAEVLDEVRIAARANPSLTLEFTPHGGHVGFVSGRWPGRASYYAEWRACEFLARALQERSAADGA